MSTISFGGLATGLDTNSIVSKLVAIESAPANAIAQRSADAQTRIKTLTDLVTKLTALGTATKAVDTSDELRGRKVAVTGSELTAEGTSAAVAGSWTVKVEQLARPQTSRSRELPSRDAGVLGTGSISIQVGTASINVAYGAADSLDDIAARITASGAGVTAGVIDTGSGFRLVTTAASGTAAAATFTETGDGLGVVEADSARDARIVVAGTTVTRGSNDVTGVVPGVTLHLGAVTAAGTDGARLTISGDVSTARAKAQGLVDAYNAVAKVLDSQLRYDGTRKGESTLFGDPTLQGLQRRLSTTWASSFGGTSAAEVGITRGADGTLTLDATKFDAAAPGKLEALLTGTTGLAASLTASVTAMTTAQTGQLTAKQAGLNARVKGYSAQITRIQENADALGERLRRQFSALEQVVSGMQSNLNYLNSIGF